MQLKTQKDLESFFEQHYKNAVIQATRIVKDQGTGEDLVQECFIKLWEKRNDIKTVSLIAYFSKMVKNKCLDYLRSKKPITIEPEADAWPTEDHSAMEYQELVEAVNAGIDGLPERCRQVFVLSRFEELTYKEIAESMEISTKTVENQIRKALKSIKLAVQKVASIIFF